jgi:multiple sugar transport system ATP-binding protein
LVSGCAAAGPQTLAAAAGRTAPCQQNELLLTCRLREGGQLLLVRADADAAVTLGQTVHLDVEPSGWRLFDAAGEALLQGTAKPAPEPQLPRLA